MSVPGCLPVSSTSVTHDTSFEKEGRSIKGGKKGYRKRTCIQL
jgi:hypothetical protein